MPEACCPNCEAVLYGPYCSECGQRKPHPEDYSVLGFLGDAATEHFSVDGKTVRTVRRLFRQPGQLTLDYYEGRRAQYLKPIQIFLIVNVFFLLFAVQFGLYDFTLAEYMKSSPPPRALTQELVSRKIAEKKISLEDYSAAFDRNEEVLRKCLIFLLVPLFALVVWLLHWRERRYYAEHLVFSIHFYSFFWLFLSCTGLPLAILVYRGMGIHPDKVLAPFFMLTTLLYLYLMLRTVYDRGALSTLARAVVCLVAVYALLGFYRVILFFGTYLIT